MDLLFGFYQGKSFFNQLFHFYREFLIKEFAHILAVLAGVAQKEVGRMDLQGVGDFEDKFERGEVFSRFNSTNRTFGTIANSR